MRECRIIVVVDGVCSVFCSPFFLFLSLQFGSVFIKCINILPVNSVQAHYIPFVSILIGLKTPAILTYAKREWVRHQTHRTKNTVNKNRFWLALFNLKMCCIYRYKSISSVCSFLFTQLQHVVHKENTYYCSISSLKCAEIENKLVYSTVHVCSCGAKGKVSFADSAERGSERDGGRGVDRHTHTQRNKQNISRVTASLVLLLMENTVSENYGKSGQ